MMFFIYHGCGLFMDPLKELRSSHWKEGKHDVLVLSGNSDYLSSVCQTALHDDDFGQN